MTKNYSATNLKSRTLIIVKLRQGSVKDRQGMALKAKGLKAQTLAIHT